MSVAIEEDQGTYTAVERSHRGYYAGDFSQVPMASPRQLLAVSRLGANLPLSVGSR